jgi:hypothetical protein
VSEQTIVDKTIFTHHLHSFKASWATDTGPLRLSPSSFVPTPEFCKVIGGSDFSILKWMPSSFHGCSLFLRFECCVVTAFCQRVWNSRPLSRCLLDLQQLPFSARKPSHVW